MEIKKVGNYRWTICALLFFATTVNYLDRQVLSLLKPTLEEQFHWTNSDYADIAAMFQFVYAISMLFAGRIIDKLGTKKGYALAIILWSVGAIIHALAIPIGEKISFLLGWIGIATVPVSILGFMFSRAVLGLGESGNFPAAIKATAEYFPKKERSFATGIFNSGSNVGAILAPLSVPWIALHWGWESAFLIIGAIGFIWLAFWLICYERPDQQKRLSKEEFDYINSDQEDHKAEVAAGGTEKVSWVRLLGYRQTWAFTFGKFMTDGVWWFFLFWLPAFLKDQYHIQGLATQIPLAVLYSMTMFGSIGGGYFPAYFIKKGYTPYDGRMRAMLLIAFIPLVVLLAQPLGHTSYWMPVILIGIGASAHQAWSANIFTTVSDMFPKKTVGSVIGIGGMAGGLGGVLITKLGGALFDYYKALGHIETGYTIMFAICATAYLIAWVVMKALVPKYKLIEI
ncbi:ACS family hexuronate transporter-like MFS transporter [Mucilaginibacter gracilis]|uniref:ACS family hexuronate transporter-like MFS transporter n=1 Tax=Mucilaginibacter gracilis TaxID=423350 RepID=A0A495IWP8_9SPHI|nr:MFS transporter [Mucilaginibacter gracilis]RKR80933.1 ACS family hexuronate transporter-like MFS transporter [Mucilaginibacter gracilis]